MDGLAELLSMDWSRRVGWSLLHFIWQGAIIAGLLWLTLRLLARSRPQARYAAACLAMLVMAAAPIVTFFVVQPAARESTTPSPQPSAAIYSEDDSWGNEEPASPTMPQTPMFDQYAASSTSSSTSLPDTKAESAPAVLNNAAVADNTKQPADEEHWTARISPLVEPAMPYAVAVWLAGVLAFSLWHLGGWLKVQRLRRRACPLADGPGESHWLNVAQRLAETLRIGRAVRLLKLTGAAARDLAAPAVVGILRPTVIIPAAVLTGLQPQQVEAILAHELAHIRRHDYLVNLLQALIETLLFYHPAVWWTSTRIRAECENCCDDLAVMALSVPAAHLDVHAAYAGALAALAEIVAMEKTFRPAGTATCIALAAGGASSHMKRHARNAADRIASGADRITPGAAGNLLSRIRRLLGIDVCTSPRWTAALAGVLVLTGLLTGVVFYGCGSSTTSDIRSAVGAGAAAEKNTPPQKHAAPAVSQTIQQRKESFIAATPQMQYSFVRPDGVIVELAAVSAAPSEDKKWWLPDGSPVTEPLHRLIDGREPPKIHPPGNSFAILVRNIARTSRSRSGAGPIVHLYDRHDYQMVVRVEPKQVGMGLMENYFDDHSRTEDDKIIGMRDELRICSQSFEPAVTRADVKVGLTVGQWKTAAAGVPQSWSSTGTGEREVRYGYSPLYLAYTTPGGEEVYGVTVSHQLAADQQVRVMAVLKDGTEIISRSSAMSDGKLGQINATFYRPELKMDDIKSFKLQARPLEWVEFKNVALRPEDDAHATKQPLDIFSRRPPLMVRLYPDDDQKAGLYAIGPHVQIRLWSFEFLYKSAVEGEYVVAGNNELVGRLEGAFGEGDTFYVAEPVRDGDAIKVLVRYVRGEATKEPDGGAATGVKRAYLWGMLRPDLPAGQYKVIVELVEHVRQDGKLIVAPKAANRAYERLTCEFEGAQANSAKATGAPANQDDLNFARLSNAQKDSTVWHLHKDKKWGRADQKPICQDLLTNQAVYSANATAWTTAAIDLAESQGWTDMAPLIRRIYEKPQNIWILERAFRYVRRLDNKPISPELVSAAEVVNNSGRYANNVTDEQLKAAKDYLITSSDKEAVLVYALKIAAWHSGKGGTDRGQLAAVDILKTLEKATVSGRIRQLYSDCHVNVFQDSLKWLAGRLSVDISDIRARQDQVALAVEAYLAEHSPASKKHVGQYAGMEEATAELAEAIAGKMPARWEIESQQCEQMKGDNWPSGRAIQIVLRTKSPQMVTDVKSGRRGSARLAIMVGPFSRPDPRRAEFAQAGNAQELGNWRGCTVFWIGAGGDDWPTIEADILAALKATDAAVESTPTPDPASATMPPKMPANDAMSQLAASVLPDWVEQVRVMARRQRAARNLQAIFQAMSVYAGPSSRHLPTVPQYRMRHFAGHWLPGAGRFGSDTGSVESP